MLSIHLPGGKWEFDELEPLGPAGGFGEVFRGQGKSGPAAIKRLKLSPEVAATAHREMDIGARLSAGDFPHVMPVLDYGQDAESGRFFLVMPIAEKSLQDHLSAVGPLGLGEARSIALNVADGLLEVSGLIHRDLKPGNVLLYGATWRIADFGIAKFVEDATSLETLRDVLTPFYAAPEQWRGDRPTASTDVYALGCMIHTMLNGQPPYVGDAIAVREGHLHSDPPPLAGVDFRLANFVRLMLRKAPDGRPSIARCREIISEAEAPAIRPVTSALAAAASRVSEESSKREAELARMAAEQRQVDALAKEGVTELDGLAGRLLNSILAASDEATPSPAGPRHVINRRSIQFGAAKLSMGGAGSLRQIRSVPQGRSALTSIVATAQIGLTQEHDHRHGFVQTFSASLLYAEAGAGNGFRWYEVGFYPQVGTSEFTSFAADFDQMRQAFSLSVGSIAVAYGPLLLDGEEEATFQERWQNLIGRAAVGELRSPPGLPINQQYFEA